MNNKDKRLQDKIKEIYAFKVEDISNKKGDGKMSNAEFAHIIGVTPETLSRAKKDKEKMKEFIGRYRDVKTLEALKELGYL